MLPTTDFFGHEVTRLIIGDNPFNGHSYITDVITQEELLAYHTEERIIEALFTEQQAGFNTLLPLAIHSSCGHYSIFPNVVDVFRQSSSHTPLSGLN